MSLPVGSQIFQKSCEQLRKPSGFRYATASSEYLEGGAFSFYHERLLCRCKILAKPLNEANICINQHTSFCLNTGPTIDGYTCTRV